MRGSLPRARVIEEIIQIPRLAHQSRKARWNPTSATRGGEVVGARPLFNHRLSAGSHDRDAPSRALQLSVFNTVLHRPRERLTRVISLGTLLMGFLLFRHPRIDEERRNLTSAQRTL